MARTETPQDRLDWAQARRLYESGRSYRSCSSAVGGRLSYDRIRRRALSEGWENAGLLPEEINAQTAAATAKGMRSMAERKMALVDKMLGAADRLVDQAFEPSERIEVKTVSTGVGESEVEVVRVPLAEPTPADKKALVTSAAILTDKVLLMTGEATSRAEVTGSREDVEARARQIRDQLAERRAAKEAALLADEG